MGLRGPGAHPLSAKLGDRWDPLTRMNISLRASLAARIQEEIPAGERSAVIASLVEEALDERALVAAPPPRKRNGRRR